MIQSSDALGYDLAGRVIVRSSFPRSIYDGDVIGKGKVGGRNSHISNYIGSPKLQQGRKRWQCVGTHEKSISEPRIIERNEMGGEIVKKYPYLEEDCLAMSGKGV